MNAAATMTASTTTFAPFGMTNQPALFDASYCYADNAIKQSTVSDETKVANDVRVFVENALAKINARIQERFTMNDRRHGIVVFIEKDAEFLNDNLINLGLIEETRKLTKIEARVFYNTLINTILNICKKSDIPAYKEDWHIGFEYDIIIIPPDFFIPAEPELPVVSELQAVPVEYLEEEKHPLAKRIWQSTKAVGVTLALAGATFFTFFCLTC